MKKITWLFLSLMLLLGMGTASAQTSTPVIISPVNGATVQPGQPIKFATNADYSKMGTLLFFTFDDAASLETSDIMENLNDIMDASPGFYNGICGGIYGGADYSSDDPNEAEIAAWMPTPTIPSNASGTVTLRARAMNMSGYSLSDMVTATYTVGEVTPVPAPTFSLAAGAVPMNTKVSVVKPEMPDDGFDYNILYILNNPSFDFTQYKCADKLVCGDEGPSVPTSMEYKQPFTITEETTITVIMMRFEGYSQKIAGWSEPVTATYTIKAAPEPPVAPTFNPNGGTVAYGTKVVLTNGTTDKAIYYSLKEGNAKADFEAIATQTQLTAAVADATLLLYPEGGIRLTTLSTQAVKRITAASVDFDDEGNAIWSEVVMKNFTVTPTAQPAAPTFDPEDGEMEANTPVAIACAASTDENFTHRAYYVLNNEEFNFTQYSDQAAITAAGAAYASPYTLTANTTITAATAKIDATTQEIVNWSAKASATYTIKNTPEPPAPINAPAAPTFKPDGGEVYAQQEITLSTTTTGANIYYANNPNFSQYTTQDELDAAVNNDIGYGDNPVLYKSNDKPTADLWGDAEGSTVSISAAAALVADDGTLTWSDATTRQFTIKKKELPEGAVGIPVITPANDAIVRMGTMVTITCEPEDAEIYYTTDGTAPYTLDDKGDIAGINESAIKYTEPFALEQSMLIAEGREYSLRIRAIATKDGQFSMGAAAGYVVYPNKPTFSPAAGPVLEGTKVEIKCVPTFSDIYYTTDGSTPTMENSPKYTEPIEITEAMTIKAIAVLGQYQESASASYIIGEPIEPLTLTFDPASGSEVEEGTEVVVTPSRELGEDEVLFFAMFATKEAAEACTDEEMLNEAKFYGEPDPEDETIGYPVITKAAPVLKIGFISGEDEEVGYLFTWMYAEYTIKEEPIVEEKDTLPMPKFSLVAGEVTKGITVTLSCDTADAKIYYSINADTVTENSLEYTAAIAIDSNMSIRAIAVKEGFVNSPVAVAAYTVKEEETANEGAELVGVRVYPNPNAGTFSVDVPERARVEIFGLNGALLTSREVNAGVAAFNLDHSGIYFVRVTANNKTAVKRVVVR